MTPMEAWSNISRRLAQYAREHGYTQWDLEAETICFQSLKEADNNGNGQRNP